MKSKRRPRVRGRAPAALLTMLILAIAWSPRLRLGALGDRAVDLRIQDLILVVALGLLILAPSVGPGPKMRLAWGHWLPLFAYFSILLTLMHLAFDDSSAIRRFAYLGRTLEAFVLAAVVCLLYLATGPRARTVAIRALHIAILGNLAWVAFQVATGVSRTLLGGEITANFYGPQLIGEPSPFGTGAFFFFTAALGLAEYRSRLTSRRWATLLVVAGLLGTFLSGSRINLAAAGLMALLLIVKSANDRAPNILRAVLVFGGGLLVVATIQFDLDERFTWAGIERGLDVRVGDIWGPIIEVIGDNLFFGIGPGALDTAEYSWPEAHSIYLRALLDYGLVGAILFFAVFAAIVVRARRASRLTSAGPHLPAFATATCMLIIGFALAGIVQETFTVVTSTHLMMLMTGLFAGELVVKDRLDQPVPARCRDVALANWR